MLAGDRIGKAGMPGASPRRGNGRQSQCAKGILIDFWQVIGLLRANRPQEAGWMIARVAQRDAQPAIIHPTWLAY